MADFDYDLFTIGGGSGGVRAARMAASYGARVAVAEEKALGGTCVNVGCVPKKLMVYASHYAHDFSDSAAYGWTVEGARFDWGRLIANKDREIARLNTIYGKILADAGVAVFAGRATIVDPHTVEVNGERHTARYILVAVGGRPIIPGGPGHEHALISDQIFALPEMPERIAIVGGGYIATEFAGIFHGLGARVVQIYRGPLFLRGFDDDVRALVASDMRTSGIQLRFDTTVDAITRHPGHLSAKLSDGASIEVDAVLCAIGRRPKTKGLGLEAAGVELREDGAVPVDDYGKTNVDSIYAVGDVTDRIQLTPVALSEGMAVAATLFDGRPTKPNHENVPSAVFSQPEIATVGLTETEARERGEILVFRSSFRPLRHTLTGRDAHAMVKLVVDAESDRVLGVHVVGEHASEILQGFAVAVKMGATKRQLDQTIGIHPTLAEELVTLRKPV
ncbi:MAG: glutathione-disulfide reductase [Polyangiaceae bacterium]